MDLRAGTLWTAAALAASLLLLAVAGGCGGGASAGGDTGTLAVALTDTPACGFDAVNITVNRLRVHQSPTATDADGGWADIVLNPPRKIDLLGLTNGVLDDLGQVTLPAGHYTQLRLVLDNANSVVVAGTAAAVPLDTPSAGPSGIKLINAFDVLAGQLVNLVLDFDACRSVVPKGNGGYALLPVLSAVPATANGISGFVSTALNGSGVTVSAQLNGTIVRSTVPNIVTGAFTLSRLPPASYDVVFAASNHATAVIGAVPVAAGGTTTVSTAAAPVTLPASASATISGTALLNPLSATVPAFVAARQTFATGPTVTVRYQAANLLAGAYSLALPIGAPLLGQFGALPIALTAQPALAGHYAVEAGAAGYQAQSVNKDITASNATQDFTLVP